MATSSQLKYCCRSGPDRPAPRSSSDPSLCQHTHLCGQTMNWLWEVLWLKEALSPPTRIPPSPCRTALCVSHLQQSFGVRCLQPALALCPVRDISSSRPELGRKSIPKHSEFCGRDLKKINWSKPLY